jgi:DNA polymerase III alpha subunit
MNVMAWAGIPIKETYDIIKNIAKKRYEKVLSKKEKFINGMMKRLMEIEKLDENKSNEIANMTWKIIEDSSRYSFNSSHAYSVAGDSLYGAWLKSHYPIEFYEVFLQMMEEDGDKDRLNLAKKEAESFFHIKFPKLKFGQDNRKIIGNTERNEVTQSIKSLKGFGSKISDDMFNLYQIFKGNTFVDLLVCAEENKFLSSKFEQLIKIGYFEDFGGEKKLLKIFDEFKSGKFRYSSALKNKTKESRLKELKEIEQWMQNENFSILEKITSEFNITGDIFTKFDVNKMYAFIMDLNLEYSPKALIHTLKNGVRKTLKIDGETFSEHPFKIGDVLLCKTLKKKNIKRKTINGKWEDVPDKFDLWLETYYVMKQNDKFLE